MKLASISLLAITCLAQQYEIGASAGGGFAKSAHITAPAGDATAGFKPGAAFGAVIGHDLYSRFGGEIRYTWLQSTLRLTGNGGEPTFSGMAHAIHYDLLVHPRKARGAQPFVAVGGGMKLYRGTGQEAAYQPMNRYAYLTRTQEIKPLLTAGAGVKVPIGNHLCLRAEFRDYITPFPRKVIAPAPGAAINGWVHDLVPMVGLSYLF